MKVYKKVLIVIFNVACSLSFWGIAQAQVSILHQPLISVTEGEAVEIRFSLTGSTPENMQDAAVFFRTDGALTYSRRVATIQGNEFVARIGGSEISGTLLEYYIEVETPTGQRFTFPSARPQNEPVSVNILPSEDEIVSVEGSAEGFDYRILSPAPQSNMISDDALIAVSFFYSGEPADPAGFRLYLNGVNVTDQSSVSSFLITHLPGEMELGSHTAEVRYLMNGRELSIVTWTFIVVDPSSRAARYIMETSEFTGDARIVGRNQQIAGNNLDFVRGSVNLRGREGNFYYSANGLVTTQESARLQPQNRYGLHLRYDDWAVLELGHVFPSINPLLLAGRRVYGLNAELALPSNAIRIQFITGELNRRVTSRYTPVEERIVNQVTPGGNFISDTTYVIGLQPGGTGTFAQNIIGGRFSVGSGRYFQLGFNALKIEDDLNSIDFFYEYNPLTMQPFLSQLNAEQRARLEADPDQLIISGGHPTPVGNVVAATDLSLRFDRNRVMLDSDAAVSLLSNDTSIGVLDQLRAEDLGFTIDENVADLLERLSWLIIINERMNALPIKVDGDESEVFIPRGIFAYQSRLGLNYFRNNFAVQYRWIGPDFISLANNGIRRDIAGFTVTDRFRMLDNSLYVSLQFESLHDNLINQLDATTNTLNYGTTISWFPVSRSIPRITTGFRFIQRDNNTEWQNPLTPADRLNASIRNARIEIAGTDTTYITLATPRKQDTWQYNVVVSRPIDTSIGVHDVQLSVNLVDTKDKQFTYGDFRSVGYFLGLQSSFTGINLRTNLTATLNNSEAQSGLTKINIYGINAGLNYSMMENKITINAETAILGNTVNSRMLTVNDNDTPNNVFDDFYEVDPDARSRQENTSYIFSGGVIYQPFPSHQFGVSGSYTNVVNRIQTFSFPNDHFLQFRYVYFF